MSKLSLPFSIYFSIYFLILSTHTAIWPFLLVISNLRPTVHVEMTPRKQEEKTFKKPLLPGCGRPLNYKPKQSDPDYIGDLFANSLSEMDVGRGLVGYVTQATAVVRIPGYSMSLNDIA